MSEIIDFKSLNIALFNQQQSIIPVLLPGGRASGRYWECGDYSGSPGNSFKFDMQTGKWKDYAAPDVSGGDITALYALQNNITMLESAKQLREKFLGGATVEIPKYSYPSKEVKPPPDIIRPPDDHAKPDMPRNSTHYVYRDANGDIMFYIVRCQDENGKKFFYPLTFSSEKKWVKKAWPYPKPLYNIHPVSKSKKPVIIVEGEKTADAAIKLFQAYDVVTWAGGSNALDSTDWTTLNDRSVIIWPDADDPGLLCAAKLQEKLKSETTVKQIKLINTDKTDGWDAFDAFEHEKWDFNKWAQWAKPLLTVWDRPVTQEMVEVLEPESEAARAGDGQINAEDIIQTDEFPATPNNQFLFNKLGLQRSGNGNIVMNASNVAKIIRHEMPSLVWRDVFYNSNLTKWQTGIQRVWGDEDTNNLFIKMQVHYDMAKLTKNHVEDAINFVACLEKRNEPQDWLNSLKWDKKPRVDRFFIDALKTKDNEWSLVVSKNFWLSLVARILSPGCQVDEMAVLESPQGYRKTSALLAIGGKWYGEVNSELSHKDFDQGLVGKIIVEFGELSAMKNSDIELVKKKITCRVDQYRPSYGRKTESFPRTCIFAGTTNEKNYLKDHTGARRFNPIEVGEIDIAYINEHREQLFAEAVYRFKQEEPWWIYPDIAKEVRESRREVDEWEVVIDELLKSGPLATTHITTKDIWLAMGGTIEKLDKTIQLRIGKIMRTKKYDKKTIRFGETRVNAWVKNEK